MKFLKKLDWWWITWALLMVLVVFLANRKEPKSDYEQSLERRIERLEAKWQK